MSIRGFLTNHKYFLLYTISETQLIKNVCVWKGNIRSHKISFLYALTYTLANYNTRSLYLISSDEF